MGKKISFGVCEWAFPVQGPYFIKMAAQMGFDGVEPDLGTYEHNFPLSNRKIRQAYLEEARKWDISFSALAVNTLCDYGMKNPEGSRERGIAVTAIEKAVQAAYEMEIDLIQLPCFEDGYINTETEYQSFRECVRYACQLAQDKGITVSTENVLSADENLRLIHEVNMPNLGIYLDTQNPFLRKGYYVPDMIRKFGKRILQVHVKDGAAGELSAALLGRGDTDYFGSVQALKEIGYEGWLVLENFYDQQSMNHGEYDPFELLKEDLAILKESFI